MDDVDLDEGIRAWLGGMKSALEDMPDMTTLEGRREYHERRTSAFPIPVPDTIEVNDRWISAPGRLIPIRIYRPKGRKTEALPLVIYLHGGGFIAGSVSTHDLYGYGIAEGADVVVVSVNYRLAPENPFPAAPEDCYFALTWLHANARLLGIDPDRIAVGGDSAGGTLTASTSTLSRDRNGPRISFQFFICATLDADIEALDQIDNKDPFSPSSSFRVFWESFLDGRLDLQDPVAVPMRSRNLAGLPPSFILTPEFHLLTAEGIRYGEKLQAAGVPTEIRVVPRTMHTFLRARFMSELAEAEFQYMCRAIRKGLGVD